MKYYIFIGILAIAFTVVACLIIRSLIKDKKCGEFDSKKIWEVLLYVALEYDDLFLILFITLVGILISKIIKEV